MPNLSSLTPITTSALTLSNLILVTPQTNVGYQPQARSLDLDGSLSVNLVAGSYQQRPPPLLFHYEGEQTAMMESDITDHYVEDNTAVQDQIALKPEVVTTHGFIGELNDVTPDFLKPVKFIADKLTTVGAYVPQLSVTAQIAYNEAFLLYQTAQTALNSSVSTWNSIGNALTGSSGQTVIGFDFEIGNVQNNQQTAFGQFYGYWRDRVLFTVQTPWAVFEDMAIKSLRAIQEAETDVITDFEVTFKRIRTASTTILDSTQKTSRAISEAAGLTNQGTSSPTPSISQDEGLTQMGAK